MHWSFKIVYQLLPPRCHHPLVPSLAYKIKLFKGTNPTDGERRLPPLPSTTLNQRLECGKPQVTKKARVDSKIEGRVRGWGKGLYYFLSLAGLGSIAESVGGRQKGLECEGRLGERAGRCGRLPEASAPLHMIWDALFSLWI